MVAAMPPRHWAFVAVLGSSLPAWAQEPGPAPDPRTPPVPDPSALVNPPAPLEPMSTPDAAPTPGAASTTDAAPTAAPSPPTPLPPPAYYMEPPPPREPLAQPPPPRPLVWEPPPPPTPIHVAPRTSLWAGARVGWFVPFGGVYADGSTTGPYLDRESVSWRDFVSSGPAFEVQLGARVARAYTVFALWERAELGEGDGSPLGKPSQSNTDFWGVGLRATSDADATGFLTEVALGYRRARTEFEDGAALELTDGVLEARIGVGAEFRLSPLVTLSPMATLGVGSFGEVEWVSQDDVATDLIGPLDDHDAHGWFTLGIGGNVDLFGQD
jgi:hypothetical protein